MLTGQNITVDHLVKVIQDVRSGKMTGSLVVTRGEGASYELGTLVFFNGRVVQARSGRSEGREALNWLLMWGKCRYTFVRSVASDTDPRVKRPFPNREAELHNRIPHVRLVPLEQAQRLHTGREERVMKSWPEGILDQPTQKLRKVSSGISRQMHEIVPYICKPLGYCLQILAEKGLSRIHRRVFLLVDGSRRVGDLMRLLKLNENDILALLYDLQDMGVISVPVPLYAR